MAEAKEIIATHDWQLLGENDTVPAGLHIKMDLSTGEKWAKIASDEKRDDAIKAAVHDDIDTTSSSSGGKIEQVEMDPSGALSIVETSSNNDSNEGDSAAAGSDNDKDATTITGETLRRDYEMMHRVMSQLPPEELERFGGLPELASPNSTASSRLTDEQREMFEGQMENIWQSRQEELAKLQDENVADLPSMLRDRIEMIKDHLMDVDGSLKLMVERRRAAHRAAEEDDDASSGDDDDESMMVVDIVDALRDLEYQLADLDMARDFHTLGGWPYLVALLDDGMHFTSTGEDDEDLLVLVNEIRALAAMTIGTSVSNLGEFSGWALEDVSSELAGLMMDEAWIGSARHTNNTITTAATATSSSALSLLIQSFENELSLRSQQMAGGSMAVLPSAASSSNATYKSRATYKLRAVYALGSLLRGNPLAQQSFVMRDGAGILARDALGTLSNVRGPSAAGANGALAKLDYKFASKVLALGEDVVMGVVLQEEEEKKEEEDDVVGDEGGAVEGDLLTANQLVAAFTTERWCDLSLRMLVPPSDVIGATASRGIKERALTAVRVLAPGCQRLVNEEEGEAAVPWGLEEVRSVRSEWNREGSDDGLDSVYRRELLQLVDGVLEVLQ